LDKLSVDCPLLFSSDTTISHLFSARSKKKRDQKKDRRDHPRNEMDARVRQFHQEALEGLGKTTPKQITTV